MSNTPVRRQFIDVRTGQLHVRTCDGQISKPFSKTAVICLHMIPKSGRVFANLMPSLAMNRQVIAPDYPGYGESDGYPEEHQPAIEDYVDAIADLIEYFEFSKVDLVGYHTGSMVSVALAHKYPDRIRKVINIGAPVLSLEEAGELDKFFAPIPLDEEGTRFRITWERIMHFSGPGQTLEMAAISMAENLRGGERYEDGHQAAFKFAPEYTKKLSEIQQPLWVMNFGDDLFEYSLRADQYFNNGSRTDFPNWGHGAIDAYPKEVADEMITFLDDEL